MRCSGGRDAFSMQVLQKALGVFGLSCQNLDSPECMKSAQHPENEVAFICNLRVRSPTLLSVTPGLHLNSLAFPLAALTLSLWIGCMPACSLSAMLLPEPCDSRIAYACRLLWRLRREQQA